MQQAMTINISNLDELTQELDVLLNVPVSSNQELENWLIQQSQTLNSITEQLMQHYIAFQRNTNDIEAKEIFDFTQKQVQPILKRYKNLLDEKYYESPYRSQLDPSQFGFLDKKIKNTRELFSEENISLEITEDELITRYFEITGNLTVMWDGEEISPFELRRYLQDPDRNIRQKAMTAISEKFLSVEDKIQEILNQLITLRTKKARNIGVTNYRDYMFKKYERFDYTAEHCTEFAESIRKYVVPLQEKMHRKLQKKLHLDTLRSWDIHAVPADYKPLQPVKNEKELIEKSKTIFTDIDSSFTALLEKMQNYLDLDSRKGKAPGGFCEYLPASKLSFIFMNLTKTQADVVVFLHEMGHCIHHDLMKDVSIHQYQHLPMETAELASMTMELFTMDNWNAFYKNKEDFKQAKQDQLTQIVEFLPFTLIIDQFQHWLYENPNHTAEERNTKFLELSTIYNSSVVNKDGYEHWIAAEWLSVLHIFEVPFYYIEYAIAQIGALQMYKQYKENPKQTLQNYKKALSLGASKSVKEIYEAAGIQFDFSSETIRDLMYFVEEELELLENL
ncbi:M3 family oligoendopeptidase [Bacillus gaemokensis]|uniref:Oligoendopeptidase F n=1 Tax=Bacillus gaemokensis TaxID=574375 RepID=A0A073KA94_9BACI|nr:M3 family oligoendopeptidase [Bacillus gaemokensis]KEK23377.1 oligoendopeptidase F [Bacillus gaemokensis]KYG25879.1 oligoendopeptidase F [Bacillus gaemokensis]